MATVDADVVRRHILWTVAAACAGAALFCVTVGVLTLVWARPVSFGAPSWWLTVPGLIVLLAGLIIRLETSPQEPSDRPNTEALVLLVVGVVAVVLVGSGLIAAFLGSPVEARPDCPFPLINPGGNKGVVVCASQERYNLADAGGQRFLYGVFFIAYAAFARAALARLRRDS